MLTFVFEITILYFKCSFFPVKVSMLQTIERYMKQAIVDKNPGISSAALVSSLHLCKSASATDIVKRSLNEIQEALNSDKY